MTQDDESGTSGYVADASTEESINTGPWKAFNGDGGAWEATPRRFNQNTGDWDGTTTTPYAISLVGSDTIYGEWVELKIPNKIQLHTCRIAPMTNSTYPNLGRHRSPRDGYILGRVGATGNWTVLKSWSGLIGGWEDLILRDFDIENQLEYYDYFRVVWTAINGNNNYSVNAGYGYASAGEIEFLGVPEYDPDAHGTDVTVKSVTNVPNTDWLEVYYDAKETSSYSGSGATVTDLSGKGVTGTLTAQGGFENVGNIKAFTSSGSTTHALTATTSFSGSPTMTISAWVKFDSFASTSIIYLLGNLSVNNQMVWLGTQSNGSIWTLANGGVGAYNQYSNDTPVLNSWIHVAAIYSGGTYPEGLSLYINGRSLTPTVRNGSGVSLTLPSNSPLYLGFYNSGTEFFDGSIANFRLFNRPLSSDEIYQLYAYQKEYFGHGDLSMTLKAGRLGIGTSEPRAMLDVQGPVRIYDTDLTNPVYAFFGTSYASSTLTDAVGGDHWRDVRKIDFNVARQSDHNAMDTTSARDVRGGFTVPVNGVYVISYSVLVARFSTLATIHIFVNGSVATVQGIAPRSHINRNAEGSFWITLRIDGVLRLKQGDVVTAHLTSGSWYTLHTYCYGSIYQIGP
jgi:hypothetical protein